MAKMFFTSESVTEGHPDKICDQISDAILDSILEADPNAHVACEVTATTGMIHVMGEITTDCYADIDKITRSVVNEIGYDRPECGFNGNTCAVISSINSQSPDMIPHMNIVRVRRMRLILQVQEIRALCSAMPAMRLPSLCLCPSLLLTGLQSVLRR